MSLDWELRLKNEVSASAKQAGVDMKTFTSEVIKAQESLYLLTLAQKKEAAAAHETKEEHDSMFGDIFKAETLKDGIEELGRKVEELGLEFIKSAIEAVDFDYKATVALTHLTGSAEQAEDIISRARAFANGVGEDLDKVTTTFQRLAATGLNGDQLTAAAAAAKDLAGVTGRSFDQTSELFEMIGSDRGLGGKAVRQLSQFPGLLQELEKHFGVLGHSNPLKELTKQLDEAPIKGAAGLNLLENMILKVAHEKQLGKVGVELGNSFEGGLTKISNDWKTIFGDLSKDPSFETMRQSLAKIADYFDPANESGRLFEKELLSVTKPFLNIVDNIARDPSGLKDFFLDAVEAAKVLAKTVDVLTTPLQEIFELVHAKRHEQESALQANMLHQQVLDAKALVAQGLSPAEASDAVKQENPDYRPPSLPAKADGGTVQSTGLVTVHEGEEIVPAGVTAGGGGGGGAGGHTFNFNISVDSGGHAIDEQAIAEKLQQMLPNELISVFEQMAQQRGG